MIDALFWYTGLVAWILIVFGVASTTRSRSPRSVRPGTPRANEAPLVRAHPAPKRPAKLQNTLASSPSRPWAPMNCLTVSS
jgi:hypothetical protein